MEAFQGNPALRCRKCEGQLSASKCVDPEKYGLVPNKFGAILRVCKDCVQLWLGYMQEDSKGGQKIILKMIDKEL